MTEDRYSEPNLLVPAVIALGKSGGKLSTPEMIDALTEMLEPSPSDLVPYSSRKDSKFSQTVRNIKSHAKLSQLQWAQEDEDGWTLDLKGSALYNRLANYMTKQSMPTPSNDGRNARYVQTIYYGVPGCGKSHVIEDEIGNLPETSKTRVVFHPDYSNADFVGQILPHVDGKEVRYDFTPGPFAKILKKALRSKERHALVIEEINRGNAAAIFGEVFQLLDRFHNDAEDKIDALKLHSGDKAGWSKYAIFNEELAKYILDERDGYTKLEPVTKDEDGAGVQYKLESGQIFSFDGIRIPPNLSIYATMNTSDQGVFTLDNAFQRRWEMKLIPNKLNDASQQDCLIADTGVTWGAFRDAINNLIMDSAQASGLSSMEDKRLGGWFILPDKDGAISKEAFANKVLKYLWDDAFKFDRQAHFDAVTTLEELIKEFEKPDGFKVFKDEAINTLQPDSSKSESKSEEAEGNDGHDRPSES
ncbi:MAG: AAA family ATPase [Fibrobacterales bacterium]|nr:AAA family ATPase [Fibrobacterales bacterium]